MHEWLLPQPKPAPDVAASGVQKRKEGEVNMAKLTLSVPEAADVLGVSSTKMYEIVKIKGFPTIHVGKRILVSAKGLERWVEEQAAKGYCGPEGNF